MRFDSIRSDAFGPFKGDELELGPRFTIVHGLNESGKSTWAAALYASLAGRRRSRGRGSRDEALFRARHKPWSGTRWQVTARITTEDGTRLAVQQDLQQGTTRIIDLDSSHRLTASELESRFGIPRSDAEDIDVGQLFGLTRGTLRATTFVPQAEVLRVIDQADELQQFLQRAASNQTIDVTASEVLGELRQAYSTRVGSASVGMRPLRATSQALSEADERAYALRAARDELRKAAAEVRIQADEERRARAALADLEAMENHAEFASLQDRVNRIRDFDAQLWELRDAPEPADEEVRDRAHTVRTAYLSLGEPPAAPQGPGVAELEQQLAELPQPPSGDTSPEPHVRALWEELQQSLSALSSVAEPSPLVDEDHLPDLASDELRELAERLRAQPPEWSAALDEQEAQLRRDFENQQRQHQAAIADWDQAAAVRDAATAQYAEARATYDAQLASYETEAQKHHEAAAEWDRVQQAFSESRARRSSGTWQFALGALLVVGGVVALLLEPVVGAALLVTGLALVAWGAISRRSQGSPPGVAATASERPKAPTPPTLPRPPEIVEPGPRPSEPALSPVVDDIRNRRQRWSAQRAEWSSQRENLLEDMRSRQLPPDPDELQGLARRIDEREGTRRAAAERQATADALRAKIDEKSRLLLATLGERGEDVQQSSGPEAADLAYRAYESACEERAGVAQAAARRDDLQRSLSSRRSEDATYAGEIARREGVRHALLTLVRELGSEATDPDQAAQWTEHWLDAQREAEASRERRGRLALLRAQLLDGDDVDRLTARLEELGSSLGEPPEQDFPPDIGLALAEAGQLVEAASTRRASSEGHLNTLRANEGDLAAALDEAAQRRRDAEAVEELRDTLSLAIEQLEGAQSEAHRSLAPALESAMRSRIPNVTAGRYVDVRVKPEDLAVELLERNGSWRQASYLSQGTTEQTYLLLRLALVEHLDTQETMPLVLDDVTVQCDADRTVALLELLAIVARDRQVVLFSQEAGVHAWASQRLSESDGDRLVSLPQAH
ncbi:AAA family ATPase [Ornithinicoccus hortensis]|uniref:Uncharacterized protein YhaN n=1 Tax=Ornithinicoccus hortensis TaxID=82346 RepID=A0A542YUS1_9MICO|nr:AAA family ATPase [Ornithinicoccus hortensis]TQL51829.1 uncharacterized protein YhaN [Ornithinicoccus hortensis]